MTQIVFCISIYCIEGSKLINFCFFSNDNVFHILSRLCCVCIGCIGICVVVIGCICCVCCVCIAAVVIGCYCIGRGDVILKCSLEFLLYAIIIRHTNIINIKIIK